MKKSTILYILLFGFILRLIQINQSLWLDEATSAIVARDLSWNEIWNNFLVKDFHPPLYYVLLKIWGMIFGTNEIALRMLSVIFGTLTIWIVYLIGAKIKSKLTGTVAALLLATAPLHIYYSQEARMYIISSFFVALSIYFFIKSNWFKFAICLTLIFLTDYLSLLILPVFWVYGISLRESKTWWKKFLLSHLLLVIAFVLIWPIFSSQLLSGLNVKESLSEWWGILGKTNIKNTLLIPVKFMIGRINFGKFTYLFVITITGLLTSYLIYGIIKIKKYILILYWLIIPILLALMLGFFIPVVSYFRLLFVLPALYILIAIGISEQKEKYFLPFLFLILILNFSFIARYYNDEQFHREDWRGLAEYIDSNATDNSKIIFTANSQMEALNYYNPDIDYSGPDDINDNLNEIWLMRYVWNIFDPGDEVRNKIEELGFEKENEYNFNGVVVWKYKRI